MEHNTTISPLRAQTHFIFYPDIGDGPGAGRYVWVDAKGRLLYFRLNSRLQKIQEWEAYDQWGEAEIKRAYYVLEEKHLQSLAGNALLSYMQNFEAALAVFEARLNEVKAGKGILQVADNQWLGHHSILGLIALESLSSDYIRFWGHWSRMEVMTRFYFPGYNNELLEFTDAWIKEALPFFEQFESQLQMLHSGDFGLFRSYEEQGRENNCIAFIKDQWMHLPIKEGRATKQEVWNPYYYLSDADEINKILLEIYNSKHSKPGYELRPLNPKLRNAADLVASQLGKSKAVIIDEYVRRVKEGMYISLGPTTDQTWTIYYENGAFWTNSYEPDDNGGYKQVTNPFSEEELRKVVATYHVFGLYRLP